MSASLSANARGYADGAILCKEERKKKEEMLKIGVCATCAVCEVLRTYVRVRACMCVCGQYVPVECVRVH